MIQIGSVRFNSEHGGKPMLALRKYWEGCMAWINKCLKKFLMAPLFIIEMNNTQSNYGYW